MCVCVYVYVKITDLMTPISLGMLSEEPVPHADTILAAVAKHLEAKLSFGKEPLPLPFFM